MPNHSRPSSCEPSGKRILVRGCVQGVGFRPFVYRLACALDLTGSVQNQPQGVVIVLFGRPDQIEQFCQRLRIEAPAQARIDHIDTQSIDDATTFLPSTSFEILPSVSPESEGQVLTDIPPDVRLCDSCLSELFDASNRRYLHPFIACDQCGPRHSIIRGLPYDRAHTSLNDFALCDECGHEYASPSDRRFHAQPIACHQCGPRMSLCLVDGTAQAVDDVWLETARLLTAGKIIALKGIGGFHLLCDAHQPEVVQRLRQRKHRPDKPFAVMALNIATLEQQVQVDQASLARLQSPAAPIVLLPRRTDPADEFTGVAPGLDRLGCLLPYTAAHYLIFHALLGQPSGQRWLNEARSPWLVVTSANRSGEPLITDNDQAMRDLAGIADAWLLHNRTIEHRLDDSVWQSGGAALCIRRARGYASVPLPLPDRMPSAPSVLACGAYLKSSVCLLAGQQVRLSEYLGDLNTADACRQLDRICDDLLQPYSTPPDAIACDAHPDFYSSVLARRLSERWGVPLIVVQHHRAHVAAVMAEHGLQAPVLGLVLDGYGLGDDGQAWGGELFAGPLSDLQRIGHWDWLPMPGGERASREIWRLSLALRMRYDEDSVASDHAPAMASALIANYPQLIADMPHTSSAGRWFDAVAALLGMGNEVSYEGQAAMWLEAQARKAPLPEAKGYVQIDDDGVFKLDALIRQIIQRDDVSNGTATDIADKAALFHVEIADGLARWLAWAQRRASARLGLSSTLPVVCAGGCFQNELLREQLNPRLDALGYRVYWPRQVPVNDGAISLGQAWLAAARVGEQ